MRDYVKSKNGGAFKACLYPDGFDMRTAFHWVCKIAIINREIGILADEANRYIDRNLCNASEAIFFQSRHSQTRLFYTGFNPRFITPEMRGNTTKIHLFQNHERNVTQYLQDAGATPETMEHFTSEALPKYSYALIETGKKPIIVSPKYKKNSTKNRSKPKASAGRRGVK